VEKVIQFIANYDEWKAVRKLKVDEKTDPRTVMEFLASLGTALDSKIEANLRRVIELDTLDSALAELQEGKGRELIAEVLAEINSRKISRVIKEICEKPELQKNEQRELIGFCRVYALKKALKKAGIDVEYSSIEIPGLKRLKKAKV